MPSNVFYVYIENLINYSDDVSFFFVNHINYSCVPGNSEFHNLNMTNQPILYATLMMKNNEVSLE